MSYCMLCFVCFTEFWFACGFYELTLNYALTHPADNQCNEQQVVASAGVRNAGVGAVILRMHQDGGRWEWWVLGTLGTLVTKDPFPAYCFFFLFFLQICKISQTYFFKLVPGNFTDLQQTLHTASVDTPEKKVIKGILIFQTILQLWNNNFLSFEGTWNKL